MKKFILLLNIFCVLFLNNFSVYSTPTTPTTISYQGVLTDGSDVLIADGEHSVTFKLYDVLNNGTELWSETQNVSTTNGLFNVDLGSVTGVTGVDFSKQLYLEVVVESIVLSPRIKFTAQPYAFVANTLNETLPLAKGGTGATTAEDARSNLGLGSMALQNEDLIEIDGDKLEIASRVQPRIDLWVNQYRVITEEDLPFPIEWGGTGSQTPEDARYNLGLGSMAMEDYISDNMWDGAPLSIEHGGTGSTTVEDARGNLGLGLMSLEDNIGDDMWSGTPLSIEHGGTGSTTAEDARGNLGLGLMAVEDYIGDDLWLGAPLSVEHGGTGVNSIEDLQISLGLGELAYLDVISNDFWSGEDLAVINGGTGASNVEDARANLGLGTLSTQAADNVTITGGTLNGTTIGASSASSSKFTSTETGSLKVTGGTPGAGKVLTSDADGNARWEEAASGGSSGTSGGAEIIETYIFSGDFAWDNFATIQTIPVPSTGQYLVTCSATLKEADASGYNFHLRLKQNGTKLTATSNTTGADAPEIGELYVNFSEVINLSSTSDLILEAKMNNTYTNPYEGKITLTKLTAPGSSSGGSTAVPTVIRQTFADQDFTMDGEDSFALAIVKTVTGAQIGDAVLINLEGVPALENPYINANFLTYSGYVSNTNEVTIRLHSSGVGGDLDYEDIDIIVTVIRPVED